MNEKILGKIDFAEYGTIRNYPFLMGLQLGFSFNNSGVADGGKYTINMSKSCKWDRQERETMITKRADEIYELLKASKCNYVSELKGKPVEVTIENNTFKDFRILTEVL